MKSRNAQKSPTGSMDRRKFLKLSAAAAAGMILPQIGCKSIANSSTATNQRPNLVFFLTDDQSWDQIGYSGSGKANTPNIDALAAKGMKFNAGYCASMPCIPSRSCIMSGLHDHRYPKQKLGLLEALKENTWTWAWALQAAGYRTALIGKMHFQPMRSQHGFQVDLHSENKLDWETHEENDWYDDHTKWLQQLGVVELPASQPRGKRLSEPKWLIPKRTGAPNNSWKYPNEYHPTTWIRNEAIKFINECKKSGEPYALLVSIRYPHPAYEPMPPYDTMYDPAAVPIPTEKWENMQNAPQEYIALGNKATGYGIPKWDYMGEQYYRNMTAAYHGLVTQIDSEVGKIMEHVNLANTLCLYSSDHGDYMGNRGRILKTPTIPLDSIAKVPFAAWGYGVPQGTTCDQPVSFMDFAPTFLQTAGAEIPNELDGTPLQNYFANPNHEAERPVYCFGVDGFNMVRRGNWKYFRHHTSGSEMLFNLETDPGEWNNLAGVPAHQAKKAELSAEMTAVLNKPQVALPKPEKQTNSAKPSSWSMFS